MYVFFGVQYLVEMSVFFWSNKGRGFVEMISVRGGFFILCALSMVPTATFSQSIAVVGSNSCDQVTLVENVRKVREALARKNQEVRLEQSLMAMLGGVPALSMAQLERALAARHQDLLNGAYVETIDLLQKEAKELMLQPPSQKRCDLVRDAYAKLAWAYHQSLGRDRDRDVAIERLARVGVFELDYYLFPPSFHQFVANYRKELERTSNSSLRVLTRPKGLMVTIDGCPVGPSPIKLRVPRGEYQVDVEFPTGRGLFKKVKVQGDMEVKFDQEFEGSIFAGKGPCVAFPTDKKKRLRAFARLGKLLGVQSVVAVREYQPVFGKKYLSVEWIDQGKKSKEARVVLPANNAPKVAIEKLAAYLVTGQVRLPVEVLKKNAIASNSRYPVTTQSKWKSKTAWSLAGIAVLLGGVAVFEHLKMNQALNKMENMKVDGVNHMDPSSRADYFQLRTQAQRDSNFRNALSIGAISAAAAGTFFWLSLAPSPEIKLNGRGTTLSAVFAIKKNF